MVLTICYIWLPYVSCKSCSHLFNIVPFPLVDPWCLSLMIFAMPPLLKKLPFLSAKSYRRLPLPYLFNTTVHWTFVTGRLVTGRFVGVPLLATPFQHLPFNTTV
jgi:hypothetical protein